MSPERTQAYKRVMRTLSDIGPSKLLATEQERVRDAADTLEKVVADDLWPLPKYSEILFVK